MPSAHHYKQCNDMYPTTSFSSSFSLVSYYGMPHHLLPTTTSNYTPAYYLPKQHTIATSNKLNADEYTTAAIFIKEHSSAEAIHTQRNDKFTVATISISIKIPSSTGTFNNRGSTPAYKLYYSFPPSHTYHCGPLGHLRWCVTEHTSQDTSDS